MIDMDTLDTITLCSGKGKSPDALSRVVPDLSWLTGVALREALDAEDLLVTRTDGTGGPAAVEARERAASRLRARAGGAP